MGAAERISFRSIGAENPVPSVAFSSSRHSRESGNPGQPANSMALDSRFRGNDEKKIVGEPQLFAPSIGLGQNEYWTRWSRSKAARTYTVGERLQ